MASHTAGKLRRGLVAPPIAAPALYSASAFTAIVRPYRSTIKQAASNARNTAAAIQEHAMRSFGEADIRRRVAIADIQRRGPLPVAADEGDRHEILVRAGGNSPPGRQCRASCRTTARYAPPLLPIRCPPSTAATATITPG